MGWRRDCVNVDLTRCLAGDSIETVVDDVRKLGEDLDEDGFDVVAALNVRQNRRPDHAHVPTETSVETGDWDIDISRSRPVSDRSSGGGQDANETRGRGRPKLGIVGKAGVGVVGKFDHPRGSSSFVCLACRIYRRVITNSAHTSSTTPFSCSERLLRSLGVVVSTTDGALLPTSSRAWVVRHVRARAGSTPASTAPVRSAAADSRPRASTKVDQRATLDITSERPSTFTYRYAGRTRPDDRARDVHESVAIDMIDPRSRVGSARARAQ